MKKKNLDFETEMLQKMEEMKRIKVTKLQEEDTKD